MKSCISFLRFYLCVILLAVAGVVGMSSSLAGLSISSVDNGKGVAPIPDKTGLAGMSAVAVMDGKQQVILAAGGANFPDGSPWEGGEKVFHSAIYKYADGQWHKIGEMPKPIAYSAYARTPKGMVVAGGCNATGHLRDVWLVEPGGNCVALPDLPQTLSYAAFSVVNNRLYLFGGQENPDSTSASNSVYFLDLSKADPQKVREAIWETPAQTEKNGKEEQSVIPGKGRILATAGTLNGKIYLMGGCSLSEGDNGQAVRLYLDEVLIFDPSTGRWQEGSARLPIPLAASASPAPMREGSIILIGGDDGSHYGKSPQTHPGQSKSVYLFNGGSGTWSRADVSLSTGRATVPAVVLGDQILVVSGETAPGIRTDSVDAFTVKYDFTLYTIDWFVFGLVIVLLGLLIYQVKKHGMSNISAAMSPGSRPGLYAWIVVAALWVVAMLNYFDRQLLTTIREPIMNDIPQTEAQFGLLTAVFLFIYSALSPVGGFLADRFSRRVVILASLTIWSAVTWLTGHVSNYQELFVARALMGISEACYIPAALALITDYHRGSTRSLATGIHMSGVYAGMAIAGYGGTLAEMEGWRVTFGLFGFIGVCYALVLIFVLKDPKPDQTEKVVLTESNDSALKESLPKASVSYALKNLFGQRAFWLLLGVMVGSGAANWLILAWFPTLLKEKFNLSLGDAGMNATLWNTLAKYFAVIVGAMIVDQWSKRNPRARQLLPAMIFVIAGPLVGATAFLGNFSYLDGLITGFGMFIFCISCQGLAQGVLDATLMPILRSHIDERFSATGYGFLNLMSAGVGGLTVLYGGQLRDAGIELTTVFACSSVLILFCGLCLFLIPKPSPEK